jgi:galactokinase
VKKMMRRSEIRNELDCFEPGNIFEKIYGPEAIGEQIERYRKLVEFHDTHFQQKEIHLFSTPGRTEIGGNHTDHSGGLVLAAGVNLDAIAVASRSSDRVITLFSEGYSEPFIVDTRDLKQKPEEEGNTKALIRGICSRFEERGYRIGGFNACMTSSVSIGSGLSSSASIEVLIGTIINTLYNDGRVGLLDLSKIGQYAENVFFCKPCGLMDQIACAYGGIVFIDFEELDRPKVKKLDVDFSRSECQLVVVETGSDHADLTAEYASIPREMRAAAKALPAGLRCRDVTLETLVRHIGHLRPHVSDRALLRLYHFVTENARVKQEVSALEREDFKTFFRCVAESGNSSMRWLQNSFSMKVPENQGITLALAVTEYFLRGISTGACRVHGGGFAGTIQAFLPQESVKEYSELMESAFGKGSVTPLDVRPLGTVSLNSLVSEK